MKGWFSPLKNNELGLFSFFQDDEKNVNIQYTNNTLYPEIYIDDIGNIISNYETWYPNIMIDDNYNIVTDDPNIYLDNNYNLIYKLNEINPFEDIFFIDDEGNLIYKYNDKPYNIYRTSDGDIILKID